MRATAADWSGHAARGAGLAAPTLKARRTLGERAASGARASRARRSRATERAAFSTAGARDRGAGLRVGRSRTRATADEAQRRIGPRPAERSPGQRLLHLGGGGR